MKLAHETLPPEVMFTALPPRNPDIVDAVKLEPAPVTLIVEGTV